MPVKYRLCSKQTHANLLPIQRHERHPASPSSESLAMGCGLCGKYQACFLGLSSAPLRLELLTLAFRVSWCSPFSRVSQASSSQTWVCSKAARVSGITAVGLFHSRGPLWVAEKLGCRKWLFGKHSGGSSFEGLYSPLEKWPSGAGSPRTPVPLLTPLAHSSCHGNTAGATECLPFHALEFCFN